MDEKEKDIQGIKKPKKIGVGFYIIMALWLFFGLGYFTGLNQVKENKDIEISVDSNLQVFRTEQGRKIYPIEYKNQLYIPFNGLGSFLNYMTIVNNETGNINLITLENDIDLKPLDKMRTEDYNGNIIDSSVFQNSEYTALMVLATWCPDCKALLTDMRDNVSYFEDNNIQLLSVIVDVPDLEHKNEMTKSEINKVYDITKDIPFTYYLYKDNVLGNKIVGNSISIPKMVIFDRNGYLVKIVDDVTYEKLVSTFDGIYRN